MDTLADKAAKDADWLALNAFLARIKEAAEALLVDTGSMTPHFLAQLPSEECVYLPMDSSLMRFDAYKDAACRAFKTLAKRFGAMRYAFICEAWSASYDRATEDTRCVAEREDRREILMIMVSAPGISTGSIREIMRDAEGKITHLGPEEHASGMTMEGRFVGLLDAE